MHIAATIACLLLAADPPARPNAELLLLQGPSSQASWIGMDPQNRLLFEKSGERLTVAAAELVRWGAAPDFPNAPLVVLADGGILAGFVTSVDRKDVKIESDRLGNLSLPRSQVAGIVLRPPVDRRQRDALILRLLDRGPTTDQVLPLNGDEVSGRVESLDSEAAQLETDLGPIRLELDRLRALLFQRAAQPPREKETPRIWFGLADGTRLLASNAISAGEQLQIDLGEKASLKIEKSDIVWIQPIGGSIFYVSDLKPAEFRHQPYLDLAWPYRADRSVSNGPLRCAKRNYLKGIGVHSAATLVYDLDGPFDRFDAEIGIDDETNGAGSVRFRAVVDGQERFASEIIRGGDKPARVSIPLEGAKRLELIVDYADRADQGDHADWLEARLMRRK